MSWFGKFFGGEQKVADASALTWSALDIGTRSKTGLSVNEATALRVMAVWGCVKVITEDVGKLPLKLIQEDRKGKKSILYSHPLYRVLYRAPNAWQTSMEWRIDRKSVV